MLLTLDLGTSLTDHPLIGLALTFAGGVVTSLTPCLYPMIPITAAIVGGGSAAAPVAAPRWRTVGLTASYVLGLAAVYATLGLIAGLTGTLFGGISTSPWAYAIQGNLLLLFALMMLDVIAVPVPRRWMHAAATQSTKGRMAGAFVMGAASGLVAAPCGAPVFGALLSWVTRTGSAVLGFAYLFAFSLGMSALLVVVGLASGVAASLPRAGVWMVWVKRGFAVLMLGAAEYYFITLGSLLT